MKIPNRVTACALFLCWLGDSLAFAGESLIQPGDRIAIVGNTFADQLRIHGYLETLLLQHTNREPVSIRNLGWAGDMLAARDRPTGFPTEESTLLAHRTDVIIACFGMGESFGGTQGLEDFRDKLRAFIGSHAGKSYNGKSEVRLILVSPIAYEDLGGRTPNGPLRNQDLEAYTRSMRGVAQETGAHFVDLFQPSRYLMDEPTGPNLTNNGIHLNAYGYWALSSTFFEQLIDADQRSVERPWRISIDVKSKTADARGVSISQLASSAQEVVFQVTEESLPSLPPPTSEPLPPQLGLKRDRLVVKNLPAGRYVLTVDDQTIVTANAQDWAQGLPLETTPSHQSAEAYRQSVNHKNLQFTYGWKALNQVHIVGERKASASGQALPAEILQFNRLANELDDALRHGIPLKTRTWRLTRV